MKLIAPAVDESNCNSHCTVHAVVAQARQQLLTLTRDPDEIRALFFAQLALVFCRLESGFSALEVPLEALWHVAARAKSEMPEVAA